MKEAILTFDTGDFLNVALRIDTLDYKKQNISF